MVARKKLPVTSPYFARLAADKNLPFVSSGCKLLDCALGGGFVLGRVDNIVGDKSSGKTNLTTEVTINFFMKHKDGLARFAEAESAFDDDYAAAMGWPVDKVEKPDDGTINTVEDFFDDVEKTLDRLDGRPCLYILDSLDALSSRAELKRELGDATYGGEKAKMMSEGFRKLVRRIEASKMLLIVISQVRDNIGAMFGEKHTRSGGKALDFYCSQIIWLADLGKIKRTVQGIERTVGFKCKAQIKKNKVGLAWRTVTFPFIYGYGIDDIQAGVEWLFEVGGHPLLDEYRFSKTGVVTAMQKLRDQGGNNELRTALNKAVEERWMQVELLFLPKVGKYV